MAPGYQGQERCLAGEGRRGRGHEKHIEAQSPQKDQHGHQAGEGADATAELCWQQRPLAEASQVAVEAFTGSAPPFLRDPRQLTSTAAGYFALPSTVVLLPRAQHVSIYPQLMARWPGQHSVHEQSQWISLAHKACLETSARDDTRVGVHVPDSSSTPRTTW